MMSLDELKSNYDWRVIFNADNQGYVNFSGSGIGNPITREVVYTGYGLEDIDQLIAVENGENDYSDWIGLFLMKDGRYLFVEGNCDYTGWDCQGGATAEWFRTLDEAVACISAGKLERLGVHR